MEQQATIEQVAARPHVQIEGIVHERRGRHHDPCKRDEYPVNPAFASDLLWEQLRGWYR